MKKFFRISLGAAFVGSFLLYVPFRPMISRADSLSAQSSFGETGPGIGLSDVFGPVGSSKSEIGPGIIQEPSGTTEAVTAVDIPNDFLDNALNDPIVKVVDRYSHEQMEADIQALQSRYGGRIQVHVIGQSHDGRAIYELIVGNVNASRHVLLQGAIHGREYMTPLLMMNQVEVALANYDTGHYNNMALSDLFDQVALHFVPMVNPDGVTLSQFGLEAIRSDSLRQEIQACYQRDVEAGKTSQSLEAYLPYWKSNAMGVDLNYNFPAYWETINVPTAAGSYSSYKGTAPLSEPETQALANLTSQRTWAATISYHSMGNVIYWDTDNNQSADSSYALASAISQVTGYRTDASRGKGGYKDWMQVNGQMTPSITIETGSVSCPMPVSEYASVWRQNKSVWARVMLFVLQR